MEFSSSHVSEFLQPPSMLPSRRLPLWAAYFKHILVAAAGYPISCSSRCAAGFSFLQVRRHRSSLGAGDNLFYTISFGLNTFPSMASAQAGASRKIARWFSVQHYHCR
jgi:hypothetical protein